MYATKAINGVPAIQHDGKSVLSVCDQNWDFANWLCALLNELGHKSELLLNERDWEWQQSERSRLQKASTACLVKPNCHPLHMDWVPGDDTKGTLRAQMRWVVDR